MIACTGSDTASANIVYQLDLGSNVTGTITTDGTTGVLQTASIVEFNIALTVGSNTGTVTGPLSGGNYVQFGTSGGSSAFTATLTALFFDFSAVGGTPYLIFQSNEGFLTMERQEIAAASHPLCRLRLIPAASLRPFSVETRRLRLPWLQGRCLSRQRGP